MDNLNLWAVLLDMTAFTSRHCETKHVRLLFVLHQVHSSPIKKQ